MTNPFVSPTVGGDHVKPADLDGHLLIISPLEYKTGITTSMGESDAIEVDLVDLTTGEEHPGTLFFSKVLVASLRPNIGQKVLATLGQGVAKPGKSAPWILNAVTDEAQVAQATAYIAGGLKKVATPVVAAPATGINVNDPAIQALLASLNATPVS